MMKKNQNGSVILEVIVAAIIFASALVVLVEFQTDLLRERSLLSQQIIALSLAQEKMESLRNYTALTTTPGQFAYQDITGSTNTVTDTGTVYTINCAVTDATDLPIRKTVDIDVTWNDAKNKPHSLKISSIIAKIDPVATGKISEGL